MAAIAQHGIENLARAAEAGAAALSNNASRKTSFLLCLFSTLLSLSVHVFKLVADGSTAFQYYNDGDIYFSIVSILILVLPSLLSAAYFGLKEVVDTTKNRDGCCLISWAVLRKTVGGLLLFFRQFIQYLAKLCYIGGKLRTCRLKATPEEAKELEKLEQKNDLLEFFEDFSAGFLAIFLQLYILYREAETQEQEKKFFLPQQLIASLLSITKLLIAVRRKDDGCVTKSLSFIGWMAMFAGRLLVFTLFLTAVYTLLFSLFLAVHVIAATVWVYSIAKEKWKKSGISFNSLPLAVVTGIVFGLPSLILWPMMFQLNKRGRPLIYLLVVGLENAAMLGFWYLCKAPKSFSVFPNGGTAPTADYYFFGLGVIGTVLGFLILLLYYCLKPKNTDKVVLNDIRNRDNDGGVDEKEYQYGLYYEFCQVIFPLKVKESFAEELANLREGLAGQTS